MSSQNSNYLMQNTSQSDNIECVQQISHLTLPQNASTNSTSTTSSTINSPRDSYTYSFISGLSIDINNSETNSENLQSSATNLMSSTSNPLILTLEAPTVSRNAGTSPIPPLILPNNEFSQNIPQNQHNIHIENVRQSEIWFKNFLNYGIIFEFL